jgi:hypothetical protein
MQKYVETEGMEMRVYNVPERVHREFKLLCVRESKSMNAKLIELMEKAIEESKSVK